MFDHVITKLHRQLDAESDADLARGMHYPTKWDPFFADYMAPWAVDSPDVSLCDER